MTVSPADPDTLYGSYGGVQVSRDGGRTWALAGSGPSELIDGPFRQAAESTVLALTRPFADEQVTVRMSALGRDGVLHGAAALVLDGELGLS